MKESRLLLNFLKSNFLFLFLPVFFGLIIGIYAYITASPQTKLSQSFRMEYTTENISESFALTDQAVVELRIADFDNLFPNTTALIYKPAPLIVSIEVLSPDKNTGFELLLKETEYLRQNFTVSTLTTPQIEIVEPNLFKYLLTGLILGFLIGLAAALARQYLKNY
ncbi:hypothetical protein HYW44_04215 [Candidatus Daviesbacteria bacterium]|nr:hypothetical protein [Candidatus Daviesbacteria bacterium]